MRLPHVYWPWRLQVCLKRREPHIPFSAFAQPQSSRWQVKVSRAPSHQAARPSGFLHWFLVDSVDVFFLLYFCSSSKGLAAVQLQKVQVASSCFRLFFVFAGAWANVHDRESMAPMPPFKFVSRQVVVACPAHTYLFDPVQGTCLWDWPKGFAPCSHSLPKRVLGGGPVKLSSVF